ncbi:hypothetical protein IWW34DRAFT_825353 [Fusarium oxysporum f. sp. albedinis]|nr:hypothetical protein IWW34DRAFT_825353 [Fusarium oxysporum f. sp. albedinis]
MHSRKRLCAPIYFEPQTIKDSALKKLDALQSLERSQEWVDDSTIFLNEDGSFSHEVIEEGSFNARTQKVSLFMAKLFSSPRSEDSKEELRLRRARRRLLVSLLAHAWLWGRPRVLDNSGNPVPFDGRTVLDPQAILNFLAAVRARKASCTYEEIRKFLEVDVQEVALREDTSKWNITGVIACLRWDKSHNLRDGGPWCSCRLEKKDLPPPYHEACRTKPSVWSVDLVPGSLVTAQQGEEKAQDVRWRCSKYNDLKKMN